MLRRSPFKDAEKNPEPPERTIIEHIGLCFSFLWFYRRLWGGIILVGALGYWLYYLTLTKPKPDFGDSQPATAQETPRIALPQVDVAQVTETEKKLLGDGDSPESKEAEKQLSKVRDLIENGTATELISASLDIRDNWAKASPVFAFLLNKDRLRISKRLLEMELSETQSVFATVSYVESVSILDSLNVRHRFNEAGVYDAVKELDGTFANHPDSTISARSHLALTLSPANRYYFSGSLDYLKEFETELKSRFDKIAVEGASVRRLCDVVANLKRKVGFEADMTPISNWLLDALKSSEDESLQPITRRFKEQILFDPFQLEGFLDRVEIDDSISRRKVQGLFETLAANPDSSSRIFQIAVDTIKIYQDMQKREDAAALVDWLDQIAEGIPVEGNKETIKSAVNTLRDRAISVRR